MEQHPHPRHVDMIIALVQASGSTVRVTSTVDGTVMAYTGVLEAIRYAPDTHRYFITFADEYEMAVTPEGFTIVDPDEDADDEGIHKSEDKGTWADEDAKPIRDDLGPEGSGDEISPIKAKKSKTKKPKTKDIGTRRR